MSPFLDHRRDSTANLTYYKKSLKILTNVFLLIASMTIFPAHWSPQQTLRKVIWIVYKDKLRRLVAEQHAVDDGSKSLSRSCVRLPTTLRAINIFSFRRPTSKYETQFILSVGVTTAMTSPMLYSVWTCTYSASTSITKIHSIHREALLYFGVDLASRYAYRSSTVV